MEEISTCSECGAVLTEENMQSFDGHAMCQECFRRSTAVCDCCGEGIWRENAEGDAHCILCYHC